MTIKVLLPLYGIRIDADPKGWLMDRQGRIIHDHSRASMETALDMRRRTLGASVLPEEIGTVDLVETLEIPVEIRDVDAVSVMHQALQN